MRSWTNNPSWFSQYSHAVLRLKNSPNLDRADDLREILKKAFTRIYRAVAFDIDGTLTVRDSAEIDPRMATIVGRLLQRGVPIILMTGRGRGSSREAANQIKEISRLSNWYMRRLQCVTGNGVYLLETPIDRPEALLSLETKLVAGIEDLRQLGDKLRDEAAHHHDVNVTYAQHSIRITFHAAEARSEFEKIARRLIRDIRPHKVFITNGRYADLFCLDFAETNKHLALSDISKRIGIPSDQVLRIGDQGQNRGNDYHFLASVAGFSVGEFSPNLLKCHPVLEDDMSGQLRGAAATEKLLREVLLFAPLSIEVTPAVHTELKTFERIALTRSRQEKETVTQRVRVRLRYLLEDPQPAAELHYLDLSDIFDDQSGGVRFREWELDQFHAPHKVHSLFDLPSPNFDKRHELRARWCMYTDTGILMRGPNYYFGETTPEDDKTVERFLENAQQFVRGAVEVIDYLGTIEADLFQFKLILAIQDNVRNILLQLLYVALITEGTQADPSWTLTRPLFSEVVAAHSEAQYKFLLNPDAEWATVLPVYGDILRSILDHLSIAATPLTSLCSLLEPQKKLFKWRECDNFLQNIAAVQLGLHELRQQPEIRDAKRLLAIGLAYGGIELPGIALAVAKARGFDVSCGLLNLSIYSDRELGDRVRARVRAGKQDYVEQILSEKRPLCLLNPAGPQIADAITIVMDDNCTTCVTLQVARDVLVTLGADVVGAVVVRFPGMNRHVHMALKGHGFPDPKVLFNFIRGLVAPSPYTRLVFPSTGKRPYFDQTKVFDKGRKRIERHLAKNGTPVV